MARTSARRIVSLTAWWALYGACAIYLLLRAEGYHLDLREVRIIETAVVSARLSAAAEVQLGSQRERGTRVVFSDVSPGRHVLRIAPVSGAPLSTVVDTTARRVTHLESIALPLAAPTQVPLATGVQLADVSADGRRLAVVSSTGRTLDVLSTVARTPELVQRVSLPTDVVFTGVRWVDDDTVVVLCRDRVLHVRLPETVHETTLSAEPVGALQLPGSNVVLVWDAAGELHSLPADGSRPVRIAQGVTSVSLASAGDVLVARGNVLAHVGDAAVLPTLPRGVRVVGAEQTPDALVAWDERTQSWVLEHGIWRAGPTDVRGALVRDGRIVLRSSGDLLELDGRPVLRTSWSINDAVSPAPDRLFVRADHQLRDCSERLRSCTTLVDGVDELWQRGDTTVVRRGATVVLLRWEAAP